MSALQSKFEFQGTHLNYSKGRECKVFGSKLDPRSLDFVRDALHMRRSESDHRRDSYVNVELAIAEPIISHSQYLLTYLIQPMNLNSARVLPSSK